MNATVFKEWFVDALKLLEEGSIIVMDNASYHSTLLEKVPRTNWKKADIQQWLADHNVPFRMDEMKAELLSKIEVKNAPRVYELGSLANEMGHEVIRLPPYHAHYNPIELIWAKIKGEVAKQNKTFKINDVEKLVHEAIENVNVEDWRKCVRHAEALQEDHYRMQCQYDQIVEPMVISLADSSDESDIISDSDC